MGLFSAGGSRPALSISADKKILTIRGALIGTISQPDHSLLYREKDLKLDQCTTASKARMNLRSKASYRSFQASAEAASKFPEGHTCQESPWRTLCCNQATKLPVPRALAEYGLAYKLYQKQHEATKADGSIDLDAFSRSINLEDMQ